MQTSGKSPLELFYLLSPDPEHNDDEGADHCGEEMTWTRDPVVENCDNLGTVVTAAKDVRKLVTPVFQN